MRAGMGREGGLVWERRSRDAAAAAAARGRAGSAAAAGYRATGRQNKKAAPASARGSAPGCGGDSGVVVFPTASI